MNAAEEATHGLETLGDRALDIVDRCGRFALLAGQVVRAAAKPRFPWRASLAQLEAIGARSLPIVLITAFFTGSTLRLTS